MPRPAMLIVGLVAAFGTGVFLYQQFAVGTAAEQPQRGAGAAELAASPKKSTVPATLPDFTLKDLDGRSHSIHEWVGRPLVINFWATWCGPCREEIPLLQQIRRERQAEGLELVGIAVDFTEDVRKFVAKTPIEYPILVGEDDAANAAAAFGIEDLALPFTVFVDRKGRILVLRVGQLHERQAKLILDTLRDVDSGALDLLAAKARVAARLRT